MGFGGRGGPQDGFGSFAWAWYDMLLGSMGFVSPSSSTGIFLAAQQQLAFSAAHQALQLCEDETWASLVAASRYTDGTGQGVGGGGGARGGGLEGRHHHQWYVAQERLQLTAMHHLVVRHDMGGNGAMISAPWRERYHDAVRRFHLAAQARLQLRFLAPARDMARTIGAMVRRYAGQLNAGGAESASAESAAAAEAAVAASPPLLSGGVKGAVARLGSAGRSCVGRRGGQGGAGPPQQPLWMQISRYQSFHYLSTLAGEAGDNAGPSDARWRLYRVGGGAGWANLVEASTAVIDALTLQLRLVSEPTMTLDVVPMEDMEAIAKYVAHSFVITFNSLIHYHVLIRLVSQVFRYSG